MAEVSHVLDILDHTVLPVRTEIAAAARHIWRERSRYVILEGDMGTGKTYLASILTLQMFWAMHSGLWRTLHGSAEIARAVCFAYSLDVGRGWKEHIDKILETGFLDQASDIGPHACVTAVVNNHRQMLGTRNAMVVLEEGTCWSPAEFGNILRRLEPHDSLPAQVVRINPFMHEAQWCGVEPGIFTMHNTTIVRMRLPADVHKHVWSCHDHF